jgi:hypothetical protein
LFEVLVGRVLKADGDVDEHHAEPAEASHFVWQGFLMGMEPKVYAP